MLESFFVPRVGTIRAQRCVAETIAECIALIFSGNHRFELSRVAASMRLIVRWSESAEWPRVCYMHRERMMSMGLGHSMLHPSLRRKLPERRRPANSGLKIVSKNDRSSANAAG